MTLIDLPIPFAYPDNGVTSSTTTELDLSTIGEKVGMIGRHEKTGTVTKVWYQAGSTSGTQTHDITIEGLSGQDPDGTPIATATAHTQILNVINIATLDGSVSVTKGDRAAIVFETNTTGTSRVNGCTLPLAEYGTYNRRYQSGAWGRGYRSPCVSLEYSDGSVQSFGGHGIQGTRGALASYDSPDEWGLYISDFPFRATVGGVWLLLENDFDPAVNIVLYDSSSVEITSVDWSYVEYAQTAGSGAIDYGYFPFDDEATLETGTVYRLGIKPSTTGSSFRPYYLNYNTTANREVFYPGMQLTNRSGAGAWSETSDEVLMCGFQVLQIDDGTGTGGGGSVIVIDD